MSDVRKLMPGVAAIVDEFAEVFGRESFTVTYASEAGHTRGKEGERGISLADMVVGDFWTRK